LEPISVFLGSTPTILPYTKAYLRIILLGAPFIMSSFVLNNQLRFQGSAAYAMVGIVTGAVVNVVLDPIFIFVFDMGVAGAALATVISQAVSFTLLCFGSAKGGNIRISYKNFRPSWSILWEMARGGFPSLCRQGLASVSGMLLNHAAGSYGGAAGDAAIAAMSIVTRVSMFANSALIGFGQGFQPVCGMNYGAKKYGRVREGFWFCVKYSFVFLVVVAGIALIFAEPIITIFRKDDLEVIKIGTLALRFHCITFPLSSWIVMCNMMLQVVGRAGKASLISAARQGVFFIPLIFILPFCFGLFGVQVCQPFADVCAFALAVPIGLGELKLIKQMEKGEK
jgi:putative MATE family efflux protein